MRIHAGVMSCFVAALSLCGPVPAKAQDPPVPADSLTLAGAAALALERNPRLQAFSRELRAADARILQGKARPNPELGFELEGTSEATISLGTLIELGGKRNARVNAARGQRAVTEREFALRRNDVLAEVVDRYLAALAAETIALLSAEAVETSRGIEESVERRVRSGASPPAELTRAGVEFARAVVESRGAEQERMLSRVRLAGTWGASRPHFASLAGGLDSLAHVPDLDSLLAHIDDNPGISRWALDVRARELAVETERSSRTPDMQVQGGVRRFDETGEYALIAGVGVELPMGNRNAGGIALAEASVSEGRALLDAARLEQRLTIIETHGALQQAQDRVRALRQAVIPGAEKAFHEIEEGYRQGRFSSLDLLEARRTWNAARRDEVDAVLHVQQLFTELERLVGAPVGGAR